MEIAVLARLQPNPKFKRFFFAEQVIVCLTAVLVFVLPKERLRLWKKILIWLFTAPWSFTLLILQDQSLPKQEEHKDIRLRSDNDPFEW